MYKFNCYCYVLFVNRNHKLPRTAASSTYHFQLIIAGGPIRLSQQLQHRKKFSGCKLSYSIHFIIIMIKDYIFL